LFFGAHEDRSDILLRNFCWHATDYVALYRRRQTFP
jgi:hypothetical protein